MERSTQLLSIVLNADHTCSKWGLNDGEIYTITERWGEEASRHCLGAGLCRADCYSGPPELQCGSL